MGLQMKNFADYLTESKKTYKFTVRVAGELPENYADTLERALTKYEIVSVSPGKKTPIMEKPMDFPQLQNLEVTHYEIEVTYPVTSHVLEHYLVNETNLPHSHIVVRGEFDPIEEQQPDSEPQKPYEALLTTEDMGGTSSQGDVGDNRVMDLLKELETARKEREIDPVDGVTAGESKDISNETNTKSPIGN